MNTAPRTEALRTAKALIGAHGLVAHMNKYNRDNLSREVLHDTTGLRYEFLLDPNRNSWAAANPSCTVSVQYTSDPAGGRVDASGGMVVDYALRITVSASATDMDVETFRQRESMMSMLGMLCEMLHASLPETMTLVMETAEELADKKQRSKEQLIGQEIFSNIGSAVLKGLRKGGAARTFRLTEQYHSTAGEYPAQGTYRFRHVRLVDRRGRPKDIAFYTFRVLSGDGTVPPVVAVRRVPEP